LGEEGGGVCDCCSRLGTLEKSRTRRLRGDTWAGRTKREQCSGAWIAGPPAAGFRGLHVMWPCCFWISAITGLRRMTSRRDSLNPEGFTNSMPPSTAMTGRYMPANIWMMRIERRWFWRWYRLFHTV